jgi:lysophospholipase L1-like esterase
LSLEAKVGAAGIVVLVLAILLLGAGTGRSSSRGGLALEPRTAAQPLPRTTLVSLGDSLTRAWGAGGTAADYPQASWATGTLGAVGSDYLHLSSERPPQHWRSFNAAHSGSPLSDTESAAALAVRRRAGYVTIEAGTNDVCVRSAAGMTPVPRFAATLERTLTQLTAGLPGVQVYVASIPNWVGFWSRYRADARARAGWAAYGRCPLLLAPHARPAARRALALRIAALNRVLGRVCGRFEGCVFDRGAMFRLWPSLRRSELAFDFFHLSLGGQRRLAASLRRAFARPA